MVDCRLSGKDKRSTRAAADVAVLLDPPAFTEPAPKPAPELARTASRAEAKDFATESAKAAAADSPQPGQPGPQILPVPGSSTTVNVFPGEGEGGRAMPQVSVQLPEGSQQVGRSVLFATSSWRLNEEAWHEINVIAVAVKGKGGLRVTLVAGADPTGTEERNGTLAERRGAVVKAALMARGLVVDLLVVGDALVPAKTPAAQRAEFRAVRVFTVERPATALR